MPASVTAPWGHHRNRTPILDSDLGDAAPIRTQVYVNPILEAINTPRLNISSKHEISQ